MAHSLSGRMSFDDRGAGPRGSAPRRSVRKPRAAPGQGSEGEEFGDAGELQTLLRAARRRQALMADFAKDAMENITLERLLHEATLRIVEGMGVERAKVLRYRPETADLLVVAGAGWEDGVVGHAVLDSNMTSPAGRAFQTGQSVLIDDLAVAEGFRPPPLLLAHAVVSLVNVPLFVDDAVWGVLEADSCLPRDFTPADADFLATFANILGAAILRKTVEARAEASALEIARLAEQRQTLLHELQHRLKNNLQIILSLIEMEQRKAGDPDAAGRFAHVADRVSAIALAHDQLTGDERLGEVKIGDYLRALCHYVDPHRDGVSIEARIADFELPLEQAAPIGLIVNEAITNAVKYAFPDHRSGQITVSLTTDEALDRAVLRIADDGVGPGEARPGASGGRLMKALAAQIGARLEILPGEPCGTVVQATWRLRLARLATGS